MRFRESSANLVPANQQGAPASTLPAGYGAAQRVGESPQEQYGGEHHLLGGLQLPFSNGALNPASQGR